MRSGFISIVGRPNVGKSTIVNALVGEKVAIVSDKPQTTRNRIMGVVNRPEFQMVLLDTPGVHTPRTKLGQFMDTAVSGALDDVDGVLFVLDGKRGLMEGDRAILERISGAREPLVCANKVDLLDRDGREALSAAVREWCGREPFFVSAKTGENMPELLSILADRLKPGPMYFPPDEVTDMPEEFLTCEIIREKALLCLSDEIPHGIGVELERFLEREDGVVEINAVLYCEKKSHKGIIIGKNGAMLKRISIMAREDLESIFLTKVFLRVFVKVREDWRNSPTALRELGYQ